MIPQFIVRISDTAPPLDPNAQHAREQLIRELSKPEYQSGRPSWIESLSQQIATWFSDWIRSFHFSNSNGSSFDGLSNAVVITVVVVVLVVAFLIFGLPRLNRRSRVSGSLFGDEDERDSDTLRGAAERAAASGDYSTAIAEIFRSLARGLSERTVVTTFPGTTAAGFARQAAGPFPAFADALHATADAFDAVRYLGQVGTEQQWRDAAALERDIRKARPTSPARQDTSQVPA
ncbi:MAG: hypothetical protein JWM02_3609 [Frankiales bacterium]|nr:hypothetical protein [Frankiales bacterium]